MVVTILLCHYTLRHVVFHDLHACLLQILPKPAQTVSRLRLIVVSRMLFFRMNVSMLLLTACLLVTVVAMLSKRGRPWDGEALPPHQK